ncbi:MAG: amino acid racemase, partial [Planctomycetota bacterium]
MRTVGIIGGMGPDATVDLFRRIVDLTPARGDPDHIRILIDNNPQIPDRTPSIEGHGPSPLPALLAMARGLIASGADFLAIPCNTAHHWYDELASAVEAPILHMIRLAALQAQKRFPAVKRYGLLATTGAIRSGLYQAAFGEKSLDLLLPTPEEQKTLVTPAIYGPDGVKGGHTAGLPRARIDQAVTALLSRGAEGIVLGCTELPLLYHGDYPENVRAWVDPTEILAQTCVDYALGGDLPEGSA